MDAPLRFFDGIEGLTGREPIGGVLRIGKKSPSGVPTETDRFYICSPGLDENKVRPLHPSFARFNSAKPEHRRIIRGNLYHATAEEAFSHKLSAYVLGKPYTAPPSREPACTGDGKRAVRWYDDANGTGWREQSGCGPTCEFRQMQPPKCKPSSRLYFRVSWASSALQSSEGRDGLPEIMLRFDSGSWNTAANLKGFFERVAEIADELHMGDYKLFGLPFVLELGTKTKLKRSFPVVSISPEGDLIEFFHRQRLAIEAAGGSIPQLVGATSPEENEPEVVEATYKELSAPAVPGTLFEV